MSKKRLAGVNMSVSEKYCQCRKNARRETKKSHGSFLLVPDGLFQEYSCVMLLGCYIWRTEHSVHFLFVLEHSICLML